MDTLVIVVLNLQNQIHDNKKKSIYEIWLNSWGYVIKSMHNAMQYFSTSEIILMQWLFSKLKFSWQKLIFRVEQVKKYANQLFG